MTKKRTLSILQYNVQKSGTVMAPLLRDPAVLELDIIAIQEPWRNPHQNTTHNPAADHFRLVYMDSQNTRTCFFVNKKISTAAYIDSKCIQSDSKPTGSRRGSSLAKERIEQYP
jgi:hypothetical protein